MIQPNVVFGLLNIVAAVLIMGAGIPLIQGKIKMNRFYGIRIKKSVESEENWYKLNAYGGKQLVMWSVPMIIVGIFCFFVPITDRNKDVLAFLLGVLPVAFCISVSVIRIYAYAKRI